MSINLANKNTLIRRIIETAKGQFVAVTFTKADGSVREMTVQPAAARLHVKGDSASESAQRAVVTRKERHPHLFNVWSLRDKGFRSINTDSVRSIRIGGETIRFEDEPAPAKPPLTSYAALHAWRL